MNFCLMLNKHILKQCIHFFIMVFSLMHSCVFIWMCHKARALSFWFDLCKYMVIKACGILTGLISDRYVSLLSMLSDSVISNGIVSAYFQRISVRPRKSYPPWCWVKTSSVKTSVRRKTSTSICMEVGKGKISLYLARLKSLLVYA